MSAARSFGSAPRGAASWAVTWGVGVSITEYLTVAPIQDWGSMRQLVFLLLYWMVPYWCVAGRIFVWLADHHERIGSRARVIAALIALSAVSAALLQLSSMFLIRLTEHAFPQFERYAVELQSVAPTWANMGDLSLYQLWEFTFYGGLLMAARIFTVRAERTRGLLHQSAMARSRAEALLDAARLEALQSQIDPDLLLDSMQELEHRYRASSERAERLLEALVEFLRYAMHGLRMPVSTLEAELNLARAFSQLQQERGMEDAWRIVEESTQPTATYKFPSLLMLPLMALGGDGGRPMLHVQAHNGQTVLSLYGLSGSLSAELHQQVRARLHALYGERFHFESHFPSLRQLRITLRSTDNLGFE